MWRTRDSVGHAKSGLPPPARASFWEPHEGGAAVKRRRQREQRRRGSLASEGLLARYARRYEDRHPWLFRDFLSVQHPDFGVLEYHFRNEEVFRNAKGPPKGFSQRKMQDLLDEGNV